MMRMKASTGVALCASITSLIFVGCSQWPGGRGPDKVQPLLEQAIANQVFVEGGTFMLGDVGRPNGAPYVTLIDFSRPVVEVSIDSYSISRYETTWGEMRVYYEALERLPLYEESPFKQDYVKAPSDDPLSPYYHRKPARVPNYGEAEGYCAWLAEQTGLPFALPTEAQWEYAARSRGRNVPYATDTGKVEKDPYLRRPKEYVDPSIPPSGNTLIHSSVKFERRPVGSYPPNPLGLYDMTGNVAEWTQDWFQEDYYEHAPSDNPRGPAEPVNPEKPEKTVRDWAGAGAYSGGTGTVFTRSGEIISSGGNGFRCVVNTPEPVNGG
ncbi:MAG: sulfatase modifying factor 1 [Pseudomonadales bacterium]|jgi:sulfatase modifying factor 1